MNAANVTLSQAETRDRARRSRLRYCSIYSSPRSGRSLPSHDNDYVLAIHLLFCGGSRLYTSPAAWSAACSTRARSGTGMLLPASCLICRSLAKPAGILYMQGKGPAIYPATKGSTAHGYCYAAVWKPIYCTAACPHVNSASAPKLRDAYIRTTCPRAHSEAAPVCRRR